MTKEEKLVVCFLMGIIILGLGLKAYKIKMAEIDLRIQQDQLVVLPQPEEIKNEPSGSFSTRRAHPERSEGSQQILRPYGLRMRGQSGNTPTPQIKNRQKININTAGVGELVRLPGVGPRLAERIVEYRLQNGNFNDIKDLTKVKGIGEKNFTQMKEYLITE